MAHLIVLIVSIFMCLSCFFMKREKKMLLILISCLLFEDFKISDYAFSSLRNLLCIIFFISELKYFPHYIKSLKKVHILYLFIIVIIGALIVAVTSHNINSLSSLLGFLTLELIAKYFVIIYSFVSISKHTSLIRIYNVVSCCLICMTLIGVINYFFKYSLWGNYFLSDELDIIAYTGERFRVQSTFIYSFDYGQACVMICLFTLYMNSKKILKRNLFWFSIACCMFGIISCGCRTVLASFIIALSLYTILNYTFSKATAIFLWAFGLVIISYLFVPIAHEKVDFLLSTLDSDSTVGGSSNTMRIGQYAAVFKFVKDNIVFGLGHNFFLLDIGWQDGMYSMASKYQVLFGLEGVLMLLLLERGVIGVLIYIIFYFGLIRAFKRYFKYAKTEVSTAVSIIISFIAYGNMTGELNSAMLTFIFSGIFLKIAYIKYCNRKKFIFSKDTFLNYGCLSDHSQL